MKKTLITALVLAGAVALIGCGDKAAEETEAPVQVETQAVVQTEAPLQTEEPLGPIIAGDNTASADAGTASADPQAFPTGIPLDQDSYQEFSEPVMYEVTEDCITWSGNDVQTSGGDLVQGSIVTGVATDGHYLILDDQRVVEISHLQEFA